MIVKSYIFIVLLSVSIPGFGQSSNFEDDFTDRDISDWSGSVTDFTFLNESGNILLQLNAQAGGISQISKPSEKATGFWEFFVRLNFSPSNGNKVEFYLMSDSSDFNKAISGYMLQAGENGSADVFRLFRITNGAKDAEILTGTTDISKGGDFRVKVIRDNTGNWSLEVADSYSGNTIEEATGTDNSYTVTSHFGFRATYSSTRADKFYFDFRIEIPPLQISATEVYDSNMIGIGLNRDYDPATVQTTDFIVNPGSISPSSINQVSTDSLTIIFDKLLPLGRFNLNVSNISEVDGATDLADTLLTLFRFSELKKGEVIINEFLKDPPSGSVEYVELRNTSSGYLNLKHWDIGDSRSLVKISDSDLVLYPDSFLVVTSDSSALIEDFGSMAIKEVSLPALNNAGDQVRLINAEGKIADSLQYDSEWGGNKVALERRDEYVSSVFKENWGDSPGAPYGTPGQVNAIMSDITGPQLLSIEVLSNYTIKLVWDETITPPEAQKTGNYTIHPNVSISSIAAQETEILIQFSNAMNDGSEYSLTVINQQDIFGNLTSSQEGNFRYLEFQPSTINDIVINEILFKRSDEGGAEFIELFNRSGKSISLRNWTLKDGASNTALLPANTSLSSNEFLVLTDNESFAHANKGIYLPDFPSLNDAGDAVVIADSNGSAIDTLFYSSYWGGSKGVSIERKDPFGASNDPSNWATSKSQSGFSPGFVSTVFEEDTQPPDLIFATNSHSQIKVIFSEFISLKSNTIFTISGSDIERIFFDSTQGNSLQLIITDELIPENVQLRVANLSDVKGNVSVSQSISIAQKLSPGGIVINEILYDPLSDKEDNLPDQTEYIELYNTHDHAVSMEGVYISDAPDEDGKRNTLYPVSTIYKWISPKGYFLIYSEDESKAFGGSKLAEFFEMESESDQFTMRVDRSSLSLSPTRDAIFLSDSSGLVIDSVFYDESWQNPNRISTKGVALEKINPTGSGNDPSNWSSSTNVRGGTPNSLNSIFQESGSTPNDIGISFTPNPFSPDDDGFEDFVSINYKLDEPDYLLRVRIYDRYGREVRELVDGKPAGFSGNLIWDGLTDDRKKNRVGIYIVLFKAYNSASGKDQTFKETVILARKF